MILTLLETCMQANGAFAARNNIIGAAGQVFLNWTRMRREFPKTLANACRLTHQPSAVPDEATVKLRALQSDRIQLRLLAAQGKLDEVLQIATATDVDEIACIAVLEILSAEVERETKLELLCALAESTSKAALPAVVTLLNEGETQIALNIFIKRLDAGDYAQLVESGYAKTFTVLDILGGIDKMGGTNHSGEYLQSLYDRLSARPQEQFALLSEILGDPKPDGLRYPYEANMIGQEVKLTAIELLQNAPMAVRDRALSYGSRDQDPEVAYTCIKTLSALWQHGPDTLPIGLEPFPLLDTIMLVQLCQISSSFTWPDAANADVLINEYQEGCERMSQLAADSPERTRLTEQQSRREDQILRLTERRINSLQPLLNRITSALGVPNAQLESSDDPNSYASYLIGTGIVKVNRKLLLEDKPLSEELMSSLLHEIGHLEQDVIVIRMIADDLSLRFGEHRELLETLYERYAAGIGYAPRSMFLLAVLRLRDDQQLTEEQRTRAQRLFQAMLETKDAQKQIGYIEQRMARLLQSYEALESGCYDSQLLSCLRNGQTLNALLNRGELPPILVQELEACRNDVNRIIREFDGGKKLKLPKDPIKAASKIYCSEHREVMVEVIERLKALLLQVLREEHAALDLRFSELRRAGYHEAEAHTISDRVEVIVKALRAGW